MIALNDGNANSTVDAGESRSARHGHFGDDAERAFRRHEQMTQVVAAGILHQPAIEPQHFATTIDHGESSDPLAGIAMTQHLDATGIGRDVTADAGAATRGEIDRILQAIAIGDALQRFQCHPRLHGQQAIDRIVGELCAHLFQTQHHLPLAATAPPDNPVRPPEGTTATLCERAQRTTAAISSTVVGKAIASGAGVQRRVQSRP